MKSPLIVYTYHSSQFLVFSRLFSSLRLTYPSFHPHITPNNYRCFLQLSRNLLPIYRLNMADQAPHLVSAQITFTSVVMIALPVEACYPQQAWTRT